MTQTVDVDRLARLAHRREFEGNYTDAALVRGCADELTRLRTENDQLRQIVADCCSKLPNGAFCSPKASLEFMSVVPTEIELVVDRLRRERDAIRDEAFEEAARVAGADAGISAVARKGYADADLAGKYISSGSEGAGKRIAAIIRALKSKEKTSHG
jgi:ABC-type bacteriocin/lantibiotic exporters, contain an N-terminal double-glycine peptidase domain